MIDSKKNISVFSACFLLIVTALILSFPSQVYGEEAAVEEIRVDAQGREYSAGTVIVVFYGDVDEGRITEIVEENGCEVENVYDVESTGGKLAFVSCPIEADVIAIANSLEGYAEVSSAGPSYSYKVIEEMSPDELPAYDEDTVSPLARPNDPYYIAYQNYLVRMGFEGAWDLVQCNGRVTAAVIDSGLSPAYNDLAPNVDWSRSYDVTTGGRVYEDLLGHGTFVAGIISAVPDNGDGIAGASYNAEILPIRITKTGNAGFNNLIACLDYIESLSLFDRPDVVNCSFAIKAGNDEDSQYALEIAHSKIKRLSSEGITFIAASGNGHSTDKVYPAAWPEVIGVGALKSNLIERAGYSNYGPNVDIVAQGDNIVSYWAPSGTYRFESGTSFSCPIVSSVYALLKAKYPDMPDSSIKQMLYDGAHDLGDAWQFGHGVVNPFASLGAFTAERFAGFDRYDTSRLIANYAGGNQLVPSRTAIIVSGSSFPDAAVGSSLAGIYNAPVITTARDYLPGPTREALVSLSTRRVIIMGDSNAVSTVVESEIRSLGCTVERVYGSSRQGTAEAAYRKAGASAWVSVNNGYVSDDYINWAGWKNPRGKKMALIVSHDSFSDATSASAMSAYSHYPIFYTAFDGSLTAETVEILENGNFDEVFIIGGQSSVPAYARVQAGRAVKAQAARMPDGAVSNNWDWHMRPEYCVDRYATSRTLANSVLNESGWSSVGFAKGTDFPDSLSLAPLQGLSAGKFMLISDSTSFEASELVATRWRTIRSIRIAGDENAVSASAEERLMRAWRFGSAYSTFDLENLSEEETDAKAAP